MEESTINVISDDVEEKSSNEEKKSNKKISKSIRVQAAIIASLIIVGAGTPTYMYAKNMYNKIDTLLSLHNVKMEDGFEALHEEFGDIPGWMVDLYLDFSPKYQDQDIIKIGDTYVTESGEPFENTLKGRSVSTYTENDDKVIIDNFSSNQKLFNDADEVIDPISRKELREDYILEFGVENVKKIKEDENGEITYEALHGPRLGRKSLS